MSTEISEYVPYQNGVDERYLALLKDILLNGTHSPDRTGTGTIKVFGKLLEFDLEKFPILTTKYVGFSTVKKELLFFMRGERNIRSLVIDGVNIWNEWPYQRYLKENDLEDNFPMYSQQWKEKMAEFVQRIKEDEEFSERWGNLGPVYGYQWRHWKTPDGNNVDQLQNVVNSLKDPVARFSRRLVVSAWNPADIGSMALPPCHMIFQFQADVNNNLNCLMYQRSVDSFLGLPFNISSYALLTCIIAKITGLTPNKLVLTLGDTHIYTNHFPQVQEQMMRTPLPLPNLSLDDTIENIDNIPANSIRLIDYQHHSAIRAEISV